MVCSIFNNPEKIACSLILIDNRTLRHAIIKNFMSFLIYMKNSTIWTQSRYCSSFHLEMTRESIRRCQKFPPKNKTKWPMLKYFDLFFYCCTISPPKIFFFHCLTPNFCFYRDKCAKKLRSVSILLNWNKKSKSN